MSKISISEAAKLLNVSPLFLRMGLRQGKFPFGVAVLMKRWTYYINDQKLNQYLKGGSNEKMENKII